MATNGTDANGSANGTAHAATPTDMRAYRAPSLLQPHRARDALRDAHEGKIPPLQVYFLMLSAPSIIKVIAQIGYDVILIDQEHSPMDIGEMTRMAHDIQLVSEGRTMAWIRICGHDHANIGYALDTGASIMVPQVETVEDAKHIVSAAKFGKKINGTRSAPPGRWLPGVSDIGTNPDLTLWENLNNQAAIIIQVESKEAVDNLDAILTECGEHIDAVWLGSLDCRVSMGLRGFWGEEPEFLAVIETINKTLRKHDMPYAGAAMGTPEQVKAMGEGKAFTAIQGDVFSLLAAAAENLGQARAVLPAVNISAANKKARELDAK
ncbi:hypothetical protein VF21_05208 [Pseudogymnoascus sp. 05NY08]|nr:hypothetical protein VF21_05208 [Pseudogymnoascus sp. 05NY08]